MHCIHPKHAFFHTFPFPGPYMKQPAATMQVLDYLRALWVEYLNEQMEKSMKRGQ